MFNYLFILLSLMQGPDAKQQYIADYKAIVSAYTNAPAISYTIKFKSFDTRADRPDTILTGTYTWKGSKMYSKLGFAETYVNDKYIFKVDNAHRMAFINYARIAKNEVLPFTMIDSIIRKYKCTIESTELAGDIRRYKIEYPDTKDHNSSMQLEFNKVTHLISKITMYMPSDDDPYEQHKVKSMYKPFVEFVYSGYSFAEVSDATFSIERYVDVKGKEVKPKGVFVNYQIINSLLYNKENR